MKQNIFPVEKVTQVLTNPENYRLLERIPENLEEARGLIGTDIVGDEVEIIILDLETTGLDAAIDEIIEIGLVKALYSVSKKQITHVAQVGNYYEQPRSPITEEITHHTGITNEMVAGHKFDIGALMQWFDNDPIVIAHNAKFDRPFFEARFNLPELKKLRWACSIADMHWLDFGFESQKLEYLLFKIGYFYNPHRALIDCLATLVLLCKIDGAFSRLLRNAAARQYTLRAIKAPYEVKDELSANNYKWNPESHLGKHWAKTVYEDEYDEALSHLRSLYTFNVDKIVVETTTSRERYK